MRLSRRSSVSLSAAVLAVGLGLSACGDKPGAGAGPGAGGQMPPTEVSVVTVSKGALPLFAELPGRLEAVRSSEIRARVSGIVLKRVFQEGSEVKAGDVLYRIDPAPYQASFDSAKAQVARAEATLMDAKLKADRASTLVGKGMISRQDYDSAQANAKAAAAELAAARAAQDSARLNLGYATVTAPIAGRIGRALVTEGALVGQGEPTPLALVQQISPLYVNFTQPSSEVLKLQKALEGGQLKGLGGGASVQVVLDDGSVYPHSGKLLFSDLTVDPTTGNVTLRAELPNPDKLLLPGLYVRVRVEQAVAEAAVTVPQRAVQRNPQGPFVMLVKDGKVAVQPIKTASAQNDVWVVSEGLSGGEQVIVEGLQKVQPGMPVKALPFGAAPAAAPAQAQAAK